MKITMKIQWLMSSVLVGLLMSQAQAAVQVDKIFHHKGKLADKLVLYVSKQVACTQIPDRMSRGQARELVFMIPGASLGNEALNMMQNVHNAHEDGYAIRIQEVQKPTRGVRVAITYDPKSIGFQLERFTSIGQQEGILFKFLRKSFLQELNSKTNPIQYYAFDKKKVHVVVDIGHGGSDEGKVGCFGIKEKDVTLLIGLRLAHLLREKGCAVSLTRVADQFVALDDRTTFVNRVTPADLFVSIHANGAPSPEANGIETFCPENEFGMVWGDDDAVIKQSLGLFEKARYEKSFSLAKEIHAQVLTAARSCYLAKDRKVKKGGAQVLIGAEKPSALVEVGFLSNQKEALLLGTSEYQALLAQGICNGVMNYIARQNSQSVV